jgi:hypothetical protein
MSTKKKHVSKETKSTKSGRIIVNQMNYVPGRNKSIIEGPSLTIPGMCESLTSIMARLAKGREVKVGWEGVYEEHLNLPPEYQGVRSMDRPEAYMVAKKARALIDSHEEKKAKYEAAVKKSKRDMEITGLKQEIERLKSLHSKPSEDA